MPVLIVFLAACAPEDETEPRIPIESPGNGNGTEADSAENGGGEEAADGEEASGEEDGEGEETGSGEEGEGDGGEENGGGDEDGFDARGEVFEITADDAMRFGLARFEVDPGQRVTVVLQNIGSMAKEVMGHNFVLLDTGTDPMAFASEAIAYRDNEHIPPGREDEVIVATDILGPGESEEITFLAPEGAGDYDYICSFPGHAAAGMVGVMTVRAEAEAPGEDGDGSGRDGEEMEGNGESAEEEGDGESGESENGESGGGESGGEVEDDGDAD